MNEDQVKFMIDYSTGIPAEVAVCPSCGGSLTCAIYVEREDDDYECMTIYVYCTKEPPDEGSEEWQEWRRNHAQPLSEDRIKAIGQYADNWLMLRINADGKQSRN